VVTEAMKVRTSGLLSWQRSISASPTPSPVTLDDAPVILDADFA
jgi:uncharacterized zinc-type alcohol dehydrogenase-like protein